MKRTILGSLAVLSLAFAGCGGSLSGSQVNATVVTVGYVDASLPRQDRQKQKLIYDILVNLQEGNPIKMIPSLIKGVRFEETDKSFLEGGNLLVRWEFDGKPSENGVPVVLYFAEESTTELKKVQRTYKVKGSGSRFVVSRG